MGRPPSNKRTIVRTFRIEQDILDKIDQVKEGNKSETVNKALKMYFRVKDSTEAELEIKIEECDNKLLHYSNLKQNYKKQLMFHKDKLKKELEEKQKLKEIEKEKKEQQIERIQQIKGYIQSDTFSKGSTAFSLLNRTYNLKGIKSGTQALYVRKQFIKDKITPEILTQLEGK
jgi:hypothetical protein